MKIKTATPHHLSEIVNIAQSWNIKRLSLDKIENLGFLVSNFQEKDYLSFIHKSDYFYVLFKDDILSGFLYAYSSDLISDNEYVNQLIKKDHPAPFVLIKQICIQPSLIGQGVATYLYQYLFGQTMGYPLFAAIVLEPFNQRSVAFHERHGFQQIFQCTPEDDIPRGVWKRLPKIV
jgi:predicted GNAT superfamily acetyltransferase